MNERKSLNRGVVYGVSGLPWCRETLVSAMSLKKVMPELASELHIDQATCDLLPDNIKLSEYFDFVEIYDEFPHWRGPKFSAMLSKRFEKVLYLDGDTYIAERIDELFDVLEHFDIAAAHAPQRIHPKSIKAGLYNVIPKVPEVFPEYNAGVVSYRCNDKTDKFIKHCLSLYELGVEKTGYTMDQPAMRSALYHSDLRLHTLTPEYNLRAGMPNVVKGKVKIVHAHGELAKMAKHFNSGFLGMRVVKAPAQLFAGKNPKGVKSIKSGIVH